MYSLGDVVLFGRKRGQKTLGRIVKKNQRSYLVYSLEERSYDNWYAGSGIHKTGSVFRVQKRYVREAPLPEVDGPDWRCVL